MPNDYPAQDPLATNLPALLPRGDGHQFLVYGDSCSGVPGGRHEATFAAVNAVARRLDPAPEFIAFLGDEIIGLTADEAALRAQWRHWLDVETAWIDREAIPVFHTTSNHATYDVMSERVFAEMLPDLPRNGPPGQAGLAYFVRRGDLLLVMIHTSAMALGGEGHIETEWLARVLADNDDARHKLVLGHHPVFPVNGFSGAYQREIGHEYAPPLWDLLVAHGVTAYLCSHILAFDVQVHRGVLQITTAGAGTAHRMPEGVEYLHLVQMVLDAAGLRYQVIDTESVVREALDWPGGLVEAPDWRPLPLGEGATPVPSTRDPIIRRWRFRGQAGPRTSGAAETLLEAWSPGQGLAPLWIGFTGPARKLTISLAPETGRSPHVWFGPELSPDAPFDLDLALHPGMGPGGVLWRRAGEAAWSSLDGASPWGAERLPGMSLWAAGHGRGGVEDRPFRGPDLEVLTG
jgi:hypothetical protein